MDYSVFYPLIITLVATLFCVPAWIKHQEWSLTKRQYFWRYSTLLLINLSLMYLALQPVTQGVFSNASNLIIISVLVSTTFVLSEYWCVVVLKKYGHAGNAFMVSNFIIPIIALIASMIFMSNQFAPRGLIYFSLWLWLFSAAPVWMYEFFKGKCQAWWKYLSLFCCIELYLLANMNARLMVSIIIIPLFCILMTYARSIFFRQNLDNKSSIIIFYYLIPTLFVFAIRCFS